MGSISQREAYGQAIAEHGAINTNIVMVDVDTSSSTQSDIFAKRFPERFFNIGIIEPCMVDLGAGLALGGKIPFLNGFAALLSLRALEQVRTSVCYANLNVKLVASYAGLSDFKDGPTHHSITDIAIMRVMPRMTVIVPADDVEVKKWVPIIAEHDGPVYFRLSRAATLPVHHGDIELKIGKGIMLREGEDLTIIATGSMVGRSLLAAEALKEKGITAQVLDLPCIKPLDEDLIIHAAMKTDAVITVEEHSIIGGLGAAISELLAENHPTPLKRVGIKDTFALTGPDPDALLDALGMSVGSIVSAAEKIFQMKK